ncbi:MAG: hypothetical protein KJ771_08145 [Nanoarchaeota archaeon]|nr:hypothetical protein [Nanoarchaeota archaeon]
MELNQQIKDELTKILVNMSSTKDLDNVIYGLGLESQFNPVLREARISQGNISQLLSKFPRIREVRTRIKTIDSTLFKMIYCRKSDLNRINDIVGFMAVVDDLENCYLLFSELNGEGLKPSVRFFDTLDCTASEYRSLDINFAHRNHYFKVQVRTHEIQRLYDQGPLTPEAYKKRRFTKLRKYLSDDAFGIDYRLNLFQKVVNNFRMGSDTAASYDSSGFIPILDEYSVEDMDYAQLHEIRLTEGSKKIILGK